MRFCLFGSMLLLSLALGSIPSTAYAQAVPTPRVAIPETPFGFSRLVVRIDGHDEIGLASGDYRVQVLEHLRTRRFKAVGAENLVFDKDETDRAAFMLGGTVRELECQTRRDLLRCRLGVEWQLLEVERDEVIYKVLTRSVAIDVPKSEVEKLPTRLLTDALDSLLRRDTFRTVLAKAPGNERQSDPVPATATFAGCVPVDKKMPGGAESVLDAVVIVRSPRGFGSGFFLTADGLVITAAHVVQHGPVSLKLRDGRETPAEVVRIAPQTDVALLRPTRALGAQRCLVASTQSAVPVGTEVYAVGTPAEMTLAFTLTRGIVSAQREVGGRSLLQTDAPVNPGNSGGPLVNDAGEVIAIANAKLSGTAVEGIAFGIPSAQTLNALGLKSGTATDGSLWSAPAIQTLASTTVVLEEGRDDPLPSLDPEGDAARERRRKEEARREVELRAKLAAMDAEKARQEEIDRLTPGYLPVLRWGGVGVAGAGAVVALWSYSRFQRGVTTRPEYESHRTWNAVGWTAFGLGAGAFATSYFIEPDYPEQSPVRTEVSVGPGSIHLGGAF